jgi:hypothetical protein
MWYPNLQSAIRPVLQCKDLLPERLTMKLKVCNDKAQHGLVTENQHNIDPLFEPTCSLTEPPSFNTTSRPE